MYRFIPKIIWFEKCIKLQSLSVSLSLTHTYMHTQARARTQFKCHS
jgi:hypothetical protein